VSGDETYWTFGQALDYVVNRVVVSVGEARPFFSEHDWPSEVREAFWLLWRALESGELHAIEDRGKVSPFRWCDERWGLEEYKKLGDRIGSLAPFIDHARDAVCRTRISATDVMKIFPAPR
jgi:hypothetical protein